jgi:predicted cupin superfamily sugar epimerase
MDQTVKLLVDRLGLVRHPEGGWYKETWRGAGAERAAGTLIHFLLEAGSRSHWHRVDACELWLHQGGGALTLSTANDKGQESRRLGPDVLAGDHLQIVVEKGEWQAALAHDSYVLVACVVIPGFEFSGFELAPPDWSPDLPKP